MFSKAPMYLELPLSQKIRLLFASISFPATSHLSYFEFRYFVISLIKGNNSTRQIFQPDKVPLYRVELEPLPCRVTSPNYKK